MYELIYRFNSKCVRKKKKHANSKWILRISAVLSNDDIISSKQGLKTGVKNDIFWSEIGSGFREPGGIPQPRIPRSPILRTWKESAYPPGIMLGVLLVCAIPMGIPTILRSKYQGKITLETLFKFFLFFLDGFNKLVSQSFDILHQNKKIACRIDRVNL